MEHPDSRVVVLQTAGREEQLKRWSIAPERTGGLSPRQRRGALADDVDATCVGSDGSEESDETNEGVIGFLRDGGWTAVDVYRGSSGRGHRHRTPGARDAGMTAHRGVLHPDDYVNEGALRAAVEAELGFTYEDVHAVYRRGRLSASSLELRASVDARVLELAQAGANVAALGRALGFHVNASGACEALNNALARARKEHA